MRQIINMTPHDVHILDENGQVVHTFPFSGKTIRLAVDTVRDGGIDIEGYGVEAAWGEGNPDVHFTFPTYMRIPTSRTVFGEPVGLPDEDLSYGIEMRSDSTIGRKIIVNVYYIVSQLVKNALLNREDLLVPAEVVRDEKGNILGCRSLGR